TSEAMTNLVTLRAQDYPSEKPIDGAMLTMSAVGIYGQPAQLTSVRHVTLQCDCNNPRYADFGVLYRGMNAGTTSTAKSTAILKDESNGFCGSKTRSGSIRYGRCGHVPFRSRSLFCDREYAAGGRSSRNGNASAIPHPLSGVAADPGATCDAGRSR